MPKAFFLHKKFFMLYCMAQLIIIKILLRMEKHFYLCRHGQTNANLQGLLQGTSVDLSLNETGIAQAKSLLEKLKDKNVELVISSALRRAKQTGNIIAAGLNVGNLMDARLNECNFGDFEGLPIETIKVKYTRLYDLWIYPKPDTFSTKFPRGESQQHAYDRFMTALLDMMKLPENNIAIISHGGVIGLVMASLKQKKCSLSNCEFCHLTYDGKKLSIIED